MPAAQKQNSQPSHPSSAYRCVPPIPPATDEEVERHWRWAATDFDAILARQIAEDEELVRQDRERELRANKGDETA